jgi:Kef-type K+ transport system membrane component KefB
MVRRTLAAMLEIEYEDLFLILAVATAIPFLLSLIPRVPLPTAVVEILAGIALGPAFLNWIDPTMITVEVFATFGLAYLLFVAGLELDLRTLIHPRLVLLLAAFALTLLLALGFDVALGFAGVVQTPLFMAIVLSATALGVLTPILKDQGLLDREFGQIVFAACAIAEIVPIILLTVFYSTGGSSPIGQLLKVAAVAVVAGLIGLVIARAAMHARLTDRFSHLDKTTAQIRVRETMLILVGLVAIAGGVGVEIILGAFAAGVAIATARKRDGASEGYYKRIEAVGFGLFIPIFFVSTGLAFDIDSLTESIWTVLEVPLYLLLFLVVRGLPAVLVYRRMLTRTESVAAGFFQATNISFIVAATAIGLELGRIQPGDATALLAAGMLSVILYPQIGSMIARRYGTPAPRLPAPKAP